MAISSPSTKDPRRAFLRAGRIAHDCFASAIPLTPYVGALLVVLAFAIVIRRSRVLGLLLVTPFAIAVVLAALHYAPLGTGRTDAYLYPALALTVALAVDQIRARASGVGIMIVLALSVWALVATAFGEHGYPQEDVASMVAKAQKAVPSSDAILVYHDTNFAFALYTSWPIPFVRTNTQPMGFEAPVQRPNVFTLEPHEQDAQAYGVVIDHIRRLPHDLAGGITHAVPTGRFRSP